MSNQGPGRRASVLDCDPLQYRLNWRLLLASIACVAILIPSLYFWHRTQLHDVSAAMQRYASQLEQEGDFRKSADYLYRSLQLSRNDEPLQRQLMIRLAETYDKSAESVADKRVAISWYQRAVGMVPGQSDLQVRLAELYLETFQFDLAVKQANRVLKSAPELVRARRIEPLARYQRQRGEGRSADSVSLPSANHRDDGSEPTPVVRATHDQLLRQLNDVFSADPTDVEIAEAIVDLYLDDEIGEASGQRTNAAGDIIDRLVASVPNDYRAFLARHDYRLRNAPQTGAASDDSAQLDLERALELAPQEYAVQLAKARSFDRQRQWQESIATYRRLIEQRPTDVRGYHGLGDAQLRLGLTDEALTTWRNGLSTVRRGRLRLHVGVIAVLIGEGRYADAETELDTLNRAIRFLATSEGEQHRDAVVSSRDLLVARLHMAQSEYPEAAALLRKISDTSAANNEVRTEARMRLGTCMLKMQEWKNAAISFEQVLDVYPRSPTARLAAARAWIAEGSRHGEDQAIRLCSDVVGGRQVPDAAWQMLAQLQLRSQMSRPPGQRSWRRLEQVLSQAHAALPDSWEIPWIEANLVLVRDGESGRARALQILVQEERAHPESVALYENLVFFYERVGLSSEADRAMVHLAKLSPNSPKTLAWQVILLASRGQFERANRALGAANDRFDDGDEQHVWLERARAFVAYQAGDPQRIRDVLLAIQDRRPNAVEVLAQLADLAIHEERWVEADRWIRRLQQVEGEHGLWWRFYLARRNLAVPNEQSEEEVTRLYDELHHLRPWWAGTSMLRGMLAESTGDSDVAIEAYVDAIRSGYGQPNVYERLVGTLYRVGRFKEANDWLLQLQRQQPLNARLLDLAWSAAMQRDQAEWAERLARDNLQRHQHDPTAKIWLAQVLATRGKTDEAKQFALEASDSQAANVGVWMGLLSFYLQVGDDEKARTILATMERQADLEPAQWHAVAAQAYQRLGDIAQAESHFRQALDRTPDDNALRIRFAVFRRPFDADEAEQIVRETLQRDPANDEARRLLAVWLHDQNDPQSQREAARLLSKTEGDAAQRAADRRLEAVLLMRRGTDDDRQNATELLEALVDDGRFAEPEDRLLLSQLYEREKRIDDAGEQLAQLIAVPEPSARHLAVYTRYLLRQTKWDAARETLIRLEAAVPLSLSAVELRSLLMKATGQEDEIEAFLETYARRRLRQLDSDSSCAALMQQVASLFLRVNLTTAAERWLSRLAAKFPEHRELYARYLIQSRKFPDPAKLLPPKQGALGLAAGAVLVGDAAGDAALLAKLLVHSQRPISEQEVQSAALTFASAIERFPDDVDLLFSVASFHLKFGKTDEAIRLLEKLTQAHPQHVTAWNNLAAILADDPARLKDAARSIDRAMLAAGYPLANLLDTKAVILLRQGRDEDAAALLRQALTLPNGNDPRFHFHQSVALRRNGDAAQAEQAWIRAKELGLFQTYLTHFEQQLALESKREFDEPTNSKKED